MRIISGKHRGRVLTDFDQNHIRPTIDRVKEDIFNKIQFETADKDVLDLFAGTGAMGLECLSRYAKSVIFCDHDERSVKLIKENLKKLKEDAQVLKKDYREALQDFHKNGQQFDLIFLDPPYASGYIRQAIEKIKGYNLLRYGGIIICEHGTEEKIDGAYFRKDYAAVSISYISLAR